MWCLLFITIHYHIRILCVQLYLISYTLLYVCIVVGQGSGFDSRSWRRFLPVLQEFPLATIPGNSSDDQV